jgi:hypothetical protein
MKANLACAVLIVFLTACGSGGDADGPPPPSPTPAAPSLNIAFGLKELRFTWGAVSGATLYRLFENPDGVSGFSQIGADLTALSHDHPIAAHRRANASYRLDACNSAGCTSGAVVTPGSNLTQAIGYVKASNPGVDDEFGVAVALSADGNTLAVGAWNESSSTTGVNTTPNDNAPLAGAVYVFSRSASGWSQQAYIKASNAQGGDGFGISVALSADGNTLAVGAVQEDSGSAGVNSVSDEAALNSGAAYVFTRSAGAWSQQAYIKVSNPGIGDSFGLRLALSGDGDTLAVGARNQDFSPGGSAPSAIDSGAVYVFTRSGTVWVQQTLLRATPLGPGDGFGASVALSADGNTLAVGADFEDSSGTGVNGTVDETATEAGAVYVFTRAGSAWSQQAYVKASNTGPGDRFGVAVALAGDGDTLAVGAFNEDSNTTGVNSTPNEAAADSGAVYVFTRSATVWSQQAYVKASNTGAGDVFGISVALSGDGNTLAVGADFEDSSTTGINSASNNAASNAGAVYVFARSGAVWSQQAYVKAPNPQADDLFGFGIALSHDGNTLGVGAESEDSSTSGIGSTPNEAASYAGAVYLY